MPIAANPVNICPSPRTRRTFAHRREFGFCFICYIVFLDVARILVGRRRQLIHKIHIPVMGVCYTADTPIRVAHLGLTSVIPLVDDGLLEEYRMAYGERLGVDVGSPQTTRIGRIRAYLDFVADEVSRKFERIRGMRLARCVGSGAQPCSGATCAELTEKDRYFLMLPADSPLRAEYEQVCALSGLRRVAAEVALTEKMECGEIQANIMVSLNHRETAFDAVRGFAASKVCGSLVLSAGVNLGVFEELAKHECFYRKGAGDASAIGTASAIGIAPRKRIILKVSDYRSALIQSRYLAKKGLEVYEFRIESGVNCGGHAFCEGRKTLPEVLAEFVAHRQELFETSRAMIAKFAEAETAKALPAGVGNAPASSAGVENVTAPSAGVASVASDKNEKKSAVLSSAASVVAKVVPPLAPARITVQGGLCTAQEIEDVLALGADGVGVGTPFLLVPQATSCDAETRALLAAATRADVRLTHASPLGVPFMNLVTSSAAEVCRRKTEAYFKARAEKSESIVATSEANAAAAATAADAAAHGTETSEANAAATATTNEIVASAPAAETTAMAAFRASAEIVATPADNLPGFPCRQHYLCRSIPGFSHPVCMASREYVMYRLAEIDRQESESLDALKSLAASDAISIREKFDALRRETLSRECICRFLGNAGREEIRGKSPTPNYEREKIAIIRGAKTARAKEPVTICPGPNIAYFDREYTLLEMMQHLYGTGPTLTPAAKPHAFELEKEIFDTTLGA